MPVFPYFARLARDIENRSETAMTQAHCFTVMELAFARAGNGRGTMINIAILGAGIGSQHLDALRQLDGLFRVVAIVDKDTNRVESIRGPDNFAALTDIAVALADPQVEVVDICLPPHLHVPVTLDALAAGKHVVCEKPMATSMADADRVKVAAQQAGKTHLSGVSVPLGPRLFQTAPSAGHWIDRQGSNRISGNTLVTGGGLLRHPLARHMGRGTRRCRAGPCHPQPRP